MNLPRKISFSKLDFLEYLYDAAGNKLRQVVYKQSNINKTTDFISNFVIVNNAPAWINFDEGRVIMDGTAVHFTETHLKDHLGNTRVVFGYKNNALLVKQVSSYYPFGMNIKGLTTQVTIEDAKHPANEYLYNGKMFQDELGLDWLDYGARMYDAVLGRFHTADPMAVFTPGISPYSYADDSPVNNIDYYGLGTPTWLRKVRNFVAPIFGYRGMGKNINYRWQKHTRLGFIQKPKKATHASRTTNTITSTPREEIEIPFLEPKEAYIPTGEPDLNMTFRPLSPPTPEYRGNPIPPDKPYTFSASINFEFKSDRYDLEGTEKTLSDLVKTLIDYPQLEVIICGNAWGDVSNVTNSTDVWDRNSRLNGTPSTLGGLAGARAVAIKKYLEGKGISSSRIKAWRGNVYPDSKRGQSTSFELKNP